MSVGAGSIKRASTKANTETKSVAAEQPVAAANVIGNTSPEVIEMVENMVAKSAETKASAPAKVPAKQAPAKAPAKKTTTAKSAAKTSAAAKAPKKEVVSKEAETVKAANEPCRLTEEMPVYLL